MSPEGTVRQDTTLVSVAARVKSAADKVSEAACAAELIASKFVEGGREITATPNAKPSCLYEEIDVATEAISSGASRILDAINSL